MPKPKPPSTEIECLTLRGERRAFPPTALRFRVSAYGVAVTEGRVLLGRSAFTGRWDIPGGGIEPWETLAEGLAREFAEETGVHATQGQLLHFTEGFFSFFDHPFHSLRFYYRVSVPADAHFTPQAVEVTSFAWVDVATTDPAEFASGDLVVLRKALASA